MLAAATLTAACVVALPPGDMTFSNIHGGDFRAVHGNRENAQQAWVGGQGGRILRTDDGGDTWVDEATPEDPDANFQIEGLCLIDSGPHAGRGWAVGGLAGELGMLRRDPNASPEPTWSLVDLTGVTPAGPVVTENKPHSPLMGVTFVAENPNGERRPALLGWIVGLDGFLWHVREEWAGGVLSETWTSEHAGIQFLDGPGDLERDLFGVDAVWTNTQPFFTSHLHLYAGGAEGLLLHKKITYQPFGGPPTVGPWTQLDHPGLGVDAPPFQPSLFDVQDVAIRANGKGAVVGGPWTQGKAGWVLKIQGFTNVSANTFSPLSCQPADTCGTTVFNGGSSVGYGVTRIPGGKFLASCYGSDTWRSPDGGTVWDETYEALPCPPQNELRPPLREIGVAGKAIVNHTAFAVGHHGTIRRTTGATSTPVDWEQVLGDFNCRNFQAGDFRGVKDGWLGGQQYLVRWSDGGGPCGSDFETTDFGGSVVVSALDMVSVSLGVAVGREQNPDRRWFAWYDGSGWDDDTTVAGALTDVHAADGRFWAVGRNRYVAWSAGGITSPWTTSIPTPLPASTTLEGVRFFNDEEGLVVGHHPFAGGTLAVAAVRDGTGTWSAVDVLASDGGGGHVPFDGELLALAIHVVNDVTGEGYAVAVGTDGVVLLKPHLSDASPFTETHRDPDGRTLSAVATSPDGDDVLAGGEDGAFLWREGPVPGTWKHPQSKTSRRVGTIFPMGNDGGYVVSHQSLLNEYVIQ